MSERQIRTAVRVSNIPDHIFENVVEADDPPTVTKLAEMGKRPATPVEKAPKGFVHATHAIGELRRFAEWCQGHDAVMVAGGVYGYEAGQVRQHVAAIDAWLDRFVVNLKGEVA